jgi:TetR/AcrR family transcriptional regulator, ethionamide resistance regulator
VTVATQRTRRRQQREETRRVILDAAQEFLAEHSFRELSVDALMSRTGLTRTVFYRHFDDIPALVLALMQEVGGELLTMAQEWSAVDQVSAEEAHHRLARFVDFHARHGRLVNAVAEAAHHDEIVEQAYHGMVEGFIDLTARTIQARIDAGEIEPVDAPEIARALIGMLNTYLAGAFGRGQRIEPERALATVWTVWTRTLFPAS